MMSLDDSLHTETQLRPFQGGGGGQASRAMEMAIEREAAFSGEIETNGLLLKEPLSESNFCTPDNSFHEKRPFPKFGLEDIPQLPSLGINQNRLIETPSSDSLGPISTPC